MIIKHFNSTHDLGQLIDNCLQQTKYLNYYRRRLNFWYSILISETEPDWTEVAFHNFMLIADRLDRLCDVLGY